MIAILKKDGKYFDVEALNDMDDWRDLPVFCNDEPKFIKNDEAIFVSPDEFKDYWMDLGVNGWDEYLIYQALEDILLC